MFRAVDLDGQEKDSLSIEKQYGIYAELQAGLLGGHLWQCILLPDPSSVALSVAI